MLLIAILSTIIFRTLPVLNKKLNEIVWVRCGTTKIEIKLNDIVYTRNAVVILLILALMSLEVLNLSEIGEGLSIYNGLLQITQISLFMELFIVFSGALILLAWPLIRGIPAGAPHVASASQQDLEYQHTLNEKNIINVSSNQVLNDKEINLINYYQNYLDKSKDYTMIIFFNVFGSLLLISSFDLISLYIAIELQSFALYILATFYKESRIVTAAGLKYFLLGALSSCFILLGSALIYAFSGLTKFDSIYYLLSNLDPSIDHTQLILGFVLIFLGFLFKIGAAPLHNWTPDVYGDSPTIVTTWLTIMPKLSILILLLELYLQIDNFESYFFTYIPLLDYLSNIDYLPETLLDFYEYNGGVKNFKTYELINPIHIPFMPVGMSFEQLLNMNFNFKLSYIMQLYESALMDISQLESWNETWKIFLSKHVLLGGGSDALYNLLFISSLLSLLIGTILGLAQTQLKRLLAYSTISHLGFILLALSINTEQALDSFLFYIIQYTITNLNVFLIIIAFNYLLSSLVKNNLLIKDIKYISELSNQYHINPILTFSLIICLLSMAGVPPFIGFYSKLYVLFSAISSSEYFISLIAIIVSVISAYYYLRIITVLYSENKNNTVIQSSLQLNSSTSFILLSNLHSFIISVLSLFLVLFFLNPSLILTSTRVLSLSLFNF